MPVAYSVNADFRLFFKKLFTDFGTHVDVTQTVTDQDYDFSAIPDSWEYFYVPEYVPEGYAYDNISASKYLIKIVYKSDDDKITFFQYEDKKVANSLDKEHAIAKDITIKNNEGHIVSGKVVDVLVWNNNTNSYKIEYSNTSNDEKDIIKMAESLEIMSK